MMEKLLIIKIGGNVIDDEKALASFLKNFASIPHKKILVHGGGKIATAIGKQLNIESHYVDGRRITDDATIDLVTMVYGGLINKKIVASLQALGCNAMGITGADANLIPAVKRPIQQIDYGWVGDISSEKIPSETFRSLLNAGIHPVVAPLTHDGHGYILNTNADTIAAVLACAMAPHFDTSLIYCFEKKGILTDVDNEQSVLQSMNWDLYLNLKQEQKLFAGVLPKLQNAFDARKAGVNVVTIGHSDDLLLLVDNKRGTSIQ